MNIIPLEDRVIIELLEAETRTRGGVLIPVSSRENSADRGKIIAINPENKLKFALGDIVLFSPHAGISYDYEGKKYIIMKESGISARIKREDE